MRIKIKLCLLSAMVLAATLLSQTAYPQSFTINPVALQGQPAPGTGGRFSSFGRPCINDSGAVAFRADISGGTAAGGVFLFSGGMISSIALRGQAAPGTGSGTFDAFGDTVINNAGDVAFASGINGGSARSGIFLFSKGTVSAIALDGQVVPGTRIKLGGFSDLSINDSSDIAFAGSFTPEGEIAQALAVFLFSKGTISVIAIPDGDASVGLHLPSINSKGAVAFANLVRFGARGSTKDGGISLFSKGSISSIVSSGQSAPGTDGGTFSTGGAFGAWPGSGITAPSLNDAAAIAFLAEVSGGSTYQGIFLFSAGAFSAIALAGRTAPDTGGRNFSIFGPPSLNDSGSVAFAAGIFSGNPTDGIFLFENGLVVKIATAGSATPFGGVEGDEAPGTGGGKFSAFGSPSLNNLGSLAFAASVSGGTTSSGIFTAEPKIFSNQLFFAQFANGVFGGGSFTSTLIVTSASRTSGAQVQVDLFKGDGSPMPIAFRQIGGGPTSSFSFALPPLGSKVFTTDGQGPPLSGFARISSDSPVGGVVVFSFPSFGSSGVGESQPLGAAILPVARDSQSGLNTGVALANPGSSSVSVDLVLRDPEGQELAGGRATVILPPRGHIARFIGGGDDSLFPNARTEEFQGTVTATVATAGARIVASAFRLAPGEFTTLPIVQLK